MEWLIKRGDAVSENEPFFTSFVWTGPVSQGRIRKVKMELYADRTPREAPIARDANVQLLCKIEADVSHIPENLLHRRKGNDGQMYYELNCKIEAVCKFKYLRGCSEDQLYPILKPGPDNRLHPLLLRSLRVHAVHARVQWSEV